MATYKRLAITFGVLAGVLFTVSRIWSYFDWKFINESNSVFFLIMNHLLTVGFVMFLVLMIVMIFKYRRQRTAEQRAEEARLNRPQNTPQNGAGMPPHFDASNSSFPRAGGEQPMAWERSNEPPVVAPPTYQPPSNTQPFDPNYGQSYQDPYNMPPSNIPEVGGIPDVGQSPDVGQVPDVVETPDAPSAPMIHLPSDDD